jgi:hypothetical protein
LAIIVTTPDLASPAQASAGLHHFVTALSFVGARGVTALLRLGRITQRQIADIARHGRSRRRGDRTIEDVAQGARELLVSRRRSA